MLRRDFLVGSAVFAGGVALPAGAAETFTAADVHIDTYPTVQAVRFIAQRIELDSGGELRLRLYHAGQLGREADTLALVQHGAIDITRVTFAALNNLFPATRVLSLPNVIDSVDHLHRVLDGAPGRHIGESFRSRGLVCLAHYDAGARCFYNARRPVRTPDDLHGLKLRVPSSDIFMAMVRALGANPTPLAFGEVFSALQTGLIDGAENNWLTYQSTRQFEVARHWAPTAHAYTPDTLLMSARRFDALPSAHRDLLLRAAADSVPFMRALWRENEQRARELVLAAGTEVSELDRAAFRARSAGLLDSHLGDADLRDLYDAIRGLA